MAVAVEEEVILELREVVRKVVEALLVAEVLKAEAEPVEVKKLQEEVVQVVDLEVEQELDPVDQTQEVSHLLEEQEVVQAQEVEVEQVQEEHLHLDQHLKQAEVGQEDQELDVIYGLK